MRRVAVLNACAVLCAVTPCSAEAGEAAWRLVRTRALEQAPTYVGFVDERTGVTVGGHGTVRYTTDGGATWDEAVNMTGDRNALELLPDGFAWHAGAVAVRRSFNGGRTWYLAADFGEIDLDRVRYLSFADEVRGLIASGTRLGITADGGLSWSELQLPPQVRELAAVSLSLAPVEPGTTSLVMNFTRRKIIARLLDASGGLWRTDDGGASWRSEESPVGGRELFVAGRAPTAALRFAPSGEGVLAAWAREDEGWRLRIFRCTPGETRWTEEQAPRLTERGTLFLAPDTRLLTWKSLDGGELRLYRRPARR